MRSTTSTTTATGPTKVYRVCRCCFHPPGEADEGESVLLDAPPVYCVECGELCSCEGCHAEQE